MKNSYKNRDFEDDWFRWFTDKAEGKKAISDFTKLIELNPNETLYYIQRGLAYSANDKHDKAIADFTKAIKLNPNDTIGYYKRGWASVGGGKYDKAIADFTKVIELNPGDADAYQSRGFAYFCKHDHDKAITDYTKPIELNPNDADAYQKRGFAYLEIGENDKAIADYTRPIELNPGDTEAYMYRGFAYSLICEHDKAIADYNKAIELGYDYAHLFRGEEHPTKGEYHKAIADYEKVLNLFPDDLGLIEDVTKAVRELGDKPIQFGGRGKMKNEAEIRGRVLALEQIREGVMGELTKAEKRTTKLMIEQLLWVLVGEDEIWEASKKEAEVSDDKEDRLRVLSTGEISRICKICKSAEESQAKILVVDDEERYLKLVSNLLISEGYKVDTAVNGIDALARIKGNRYSLLLTGIRMPYMSGFEFYKYVQKIAPSLADKTVVISGSINDEDTREFLAENKLTYMAKPFDAEQLKKIVNHILTQGVR